MGEILPSLSPETWCVAVSQEFTRPRNGRHLVGEIVDGCIKVEELFEDTKFNKRLGNFSF